MPSSFRVALVGTGRVGYQFSFSDVPDNHAEAIVANPRTDLVAGVNRSREKLDAFGERFGIAALFHDMGQMLRDVKPDICIIATHPELHAQMVSECAAAATVKAIICEKPMALSLAECDVMIDACKRHDVLLQVNHNRRWHAEWQLAHKLIQEGAIGDLNHIYCYMDGCKPHPSWRCENEGPLLHDYTHYFDLMDLYAGEVEWMCGTAQQRMRPWAVEDFASAMMGFASGVTGLICGTEMTVYSDHAFEMRGTTGVIRMSAEQVHLHQAHQDWHEPDSGFRWSALQPTSVERPAPVSTYVEALSELIAALDGHGSLRSDGAVGRRSMEMVSAVYQSQATGNVPVRFPVTETENGIETLRRLGQFVEREES